MQIIVIYPGHNATVAFFSDGVCRYIHHEEKFSNIKNDLGFPKEALKFLSQDIDFSEVDKFVICSTNYLPVNDPYLVHNHSENSGESNTSLLHTLFFELEARLPFKGLFSSIRDYIYTNYYTPKTWKKFLEYMQETYAIGQEKITNVDHHLAHCLTPLYFYGLECSNKPLLLMSLDGVGDFSCGKVYTYTNAQLTEISNTPYTASVGLLYSEVTKFLGMKPLEHEYKVMGLAAYVSNRKYYEHIYAKLRELVWLNTDTLVFESKINLSNAQRYLKNAFCGERFDNVAAALQNLTEDLLLEWIDCAIKKTGISTVCFSGGVFMNVKLNQKILDLASIDKAYFQPSCGDDSLVIGTAADVMQKNNVALQPLKSMYYGHRFSNDEVAKFIKDNQYDSQYEISYHDDMEKKIALLLSEFNIVARFKGACEWGARSLCNRGILANASDLKSFFQINDMIKMRDFWMPFAPTILSEWAERYIEDWENIKMKAYDSTKYMIITCDSTKLAQEHLRAAIHQKDKTLRPQVVDEEENPYLYKLLKYFENETNMGGIMNTSLNIHGYPLVGTLEQAIFTLENSALPYIAIENYLIKKQ